MEGSLFYVVAVENPTKKDIEENDAISKVIMGPKLIMARDDRDAALKVLLNDNEVKQAEQDRLELVIRPF